MGVVGVIIAAAGLGKRFDSILPKQYHILGQHTVLAHTIEKFISHPEVNFVITSIAENHNELYHNSIIEINNTSGKLLQPVIGGTERHLSVLNALRKISSHKPDIVLIQDAARPFVSHALISQIIHSTKQYGSAIPMITSTDSLKTINGNFVGQTLDRKVIYRAQTPQGFDFADILSLAEQNKDHITDDAELFEKAGKHIFVVPGELQNVKITHKEDMICNQK
jgi:2-C-methyl-D-erythritol 4-phosphate cytidylyltransferase/2-C-methyl-D-erythritol 2,4-cyclodiphosphate synthase